MKAEDKKLFLTIRRPLASSMGFLILVLVCFLSIPDLRIQVFPDSGNGQVAVVFEAAGESARRMADNAVQPFERQLSALAATESVESAIYDGYARLVARFPSQRLMERQLPELERLVSDFVPQDAEGGAYSRRIERFDTNTRPILTLSLASSSLGPLELSGLVRDVLIPRLEQKDELILVRAQGLIAEKLVIALDRMAVLQSGMSLNDIADGLRDQVLPQKTLRFEKAEADIGLLYGPSFAIQNAADGDSIQLPGALTGVMRRLVDSSQTAIADGRDCVILHIQKKYESDVVDAVEAALKVMDEVKAEFKESGTDLDYEVMDNSAAFILNSIDLVRNSLVYSLILTALILFLMLGSPAYAFPLALTIPSAFLFALLGFRIFGISLNLFSLAGLILSIGLVVDNGIVVIEAFDRHMRAAGNRVQALSAALYEVVIPMLTSTLTTIAALIPLYFLSDQLSSMFSDLASSIILCLSSSFISAVMILPNLLYVSAARRGFHRWVDTRWLSLEARYSAGVRGLFKLRTLIFAGMVVVIAIGVVVFLRSEVVYFSQAAAEERYINIHSDKLLNDREAARWLEDLREGLSEQDARAVKIISLNHRFEDLSGFPMPSRGWMYLRTAAEEPGFIDRLQSLVRALDEESLMEEPITLKNPVELLLRAYTRSNYTRISGDNPENLDLIASELNDEYKALTGESLQLIGNDYVSRPALYIDPDIESYGVDLTGALLPGIEDALRRHSAASIDGTPLHLVYQDQIDSRLSAEGELSEAVRASGYEHYLRVSLERSAYTLRSERGRFYIQLQEKRETTTAEAPSLTAALETYLKYRRYDLEKENVWINHYSSTERTMAGRVELFIAGGFLVLVIGLILLAQFESFKMAFLILLSIPFSMVWALFAIAMFRFPVDMMVMVGMIFIIGMCVNDSILLGSAFRQERPNPERRESLAAYVARVSSRRFRPIWMTTLSSVAGLAPMFFVSGPLGALWRPLSLTLSAGLVAATYMAILILPFGIMPKLSWNGENESD